MADNNVHPDPLGDGPALPLDDDAHSAELARGVSQTAPLDDTAVDGLPAADAALDKVAVPVESAITRASTTGSAAPKPKRGIREMLPSMSGKLIVGIVLVAGIALFAIIAPLFAQNPRAYRGNPTMAPPSAEHILGTDKVGHDVFAQLAYGAKGSLSVGIVAGVIAIVLALLFGVVAGYAGGWTDEALSLITNIMLVIPGLPLVIVIASYLQSRSLTIVALVLGLTGWAGSAVVLRSQAKSLRNRDYVAAAKVAGEGPLRVITVEILPNLLPLLAGQFLFAIVFAILGEAGLSFLGVGPSTITWGTMLNLAATSGALGAGAWWWFVPPGLLIALVGCGLSLINFAIDEIINPKLRMAPAAAKSVRKARKQGLEIEHSAVVAVDGPAKESVGA